MRRFFERLLKYRKVLIYAALTAVFCSLFLFSPKPNEDYCGKYIDLGKYASFPLNCDSYDYVETAKNPLKLFDKQSIRQTRPVYVMLASALGYVLTPVFSVLPLSAFAAKDELLASPFYWGFIFLNFFFLVCSLLLFDRIVDILTENKFPQYAKYILAIFLVSNVVIKTSFWSAHQQMLTIVSPLLCIYLALSFILTDELHHKKIYLISLLGGFLMLAYGNFLILFPSVLLAMTIRIVRSRQFSLKPSLKLFLPPIALFLFPTLAWSLILLAVNGSIYSHEIGTYRQFVWIFDKLSVSFKDFYSQLISFTVIYGITIYRTVLVFIIALLAIKIFNSIEHFTAKHTNKPTDYYLMRNVMVVIFMFYLLFFWLMGYYSERLTFTLVPVVLCLIVLKLNILFARAGALAVKVVSVLLLIFAFVWVYTSVTAYGPFRDLTQMNVIESLQIHI